MNNIIIVGGNHHNTLGVVRAFGEVGLSNLLRLIVVSLTPDFISRSKYIKKNNFRRIATEDEIISALKSFEYGCEKPVIFSCSDKVTSFLDFHYDELSANFILPNANEQEGEINRLMDKTVQLEYAKSVGINVPTSAEIKVEDDIDIEWNVFPCIVKPIESILGSKFDIHICKNRAELTKEIQSSSCSRFQIQQFITKDVEYQLIGCCMGGVVIPGSTRLIRQPNYTNTGYLVYDNNFKFDLSKAEAFIKAINYRGLFSMEFLRDKDGKDFFMEINMRNDGNAYCVTCAGVNLPLIWYKKMLGLPVDESEFKIKRTVHFMPELNDFWNIKTVGFFNWIKQFMFAESHSVFNLIDPWPFLFQSFSILSYGIRKRMRVIK